MLTAWHFGVEVEASAFLPTGTLCRGLASSRGSVQLLLSCLAFGICVGSAAAPLSAQGGAEEARLSLCLCAVWKHMASGKSSCSLCR